MITKSVGVGRKIMNQDLRQLYILVLKYGSLIDLKRSTKSSLAIHWPGADGWDVIPIYRIRLKPNE